METNLSSEQIEALRSALPTRERRTFTGEISLRAEDGAPKIGMVTPFNRRSLDLGGFVEVVAASAFTKTLRERGSDVVSLWNHDPSWVLGRESNRTLTMKATEAALESEVTLDGEDPMHRHFARRVERRDVQGSSFGFQTVRDRWEKMEDGTVLRTLLEVKLFDVSPVTFPAYPDSDSEKRSAVFDVASVKAGGDLAALAAALVRSESGKVVAADVEEVRSWLARLGGLLPVEVPAGVPLAVRERDLENRMRRAGIKVAA